MNCSQCGNKLNKTDKFCTNCGFKVGDNNNNNNEIANNNAVPNDNVEKPIINGLRNDQALCILSLILFYVVPIINYSLFMALSKNPLLNFISSILNLAPLVGIGIAIYAKVHYPKSKFAKILLIIYVVQVIIGIAALIILFVTCAYAFRGCGSIGEIINLLFL